MNSSEKAGYETCRFGEYLRHATVRYGKVRYNDVVREAPRSQASRLGVTPRHVLRIIRPYVAVRVREQVRAVVPLACYLALFQVLILRQPVLQAGTVVGGVVSVILGLALFMEGLKVGLMPYSERIGSELTARLRTRHILGVAFAIGAAATMAEPAIGILRTAGGTTSPREAPLLHALLTDYSGWLVLTVALGVGAATLLGMLRSLRGWSLKPVIYVVLFPVLAITVYAYGHPAGQLRHLIGLAWDCGGITTGPVTVPVILALGVGVAHEARSNGGRLSGFGVVTLASLLPVLFVILLGLLLQPIVGLDRPAVAASGLECTGESLAAPCILTAVLNAVRSVIPLWLMLLAILVVVLRQRLSSPRFLLYFVFLCLAGMALFNIGLIWGLAALGRQVGAVIPAAFHDLPEVPASPLYSTWTGSVLAVLFAALLGFGATLAEPALRALALTAENETHGIMDRHTILRVVAIGVGLGVSAGISKILWNWPLPWLLVGGYLVLFLLTVFSDEKYVNIAWDSAGVTTGPVTVPLVIALGLGLGQTSRAVEGFGILATASMFPIGAVLVSGLAAGWRLRRDRERELS